MTLRGELEALPSRMQTLPVDARGYPVPWFVAIVNGDPDHRIADAEKWRRAVKERRCWVCGQALGVYLAFPIGPMCGINKTTTDPPSHFDCAVWAARNCPFLSRPHARRREDALTQDLLPNVAGNPILRNPGVTLVWVTRSYKLWGDPAGRPLIEIGPADRWTWYCEGRPATRAEVVASVAGGFPSLLEIARQQDRDEPHAGAELELLKRAESFLAMYPTV